MLALGAGVALAFPACASKEKVASNVIDGMGQIAPPPMTAAFDPSKQVASGATGGPWASSASIMPSASPNGASFTR